MINIQEKVSKIVQPFDEQPTEGSAYLNTPSEGKDKLKEILKQLVIASQREMGTAWCTQMINDIDGLDAKDIKKIRAITRLRYTSFTDDGSGNCIHCGKREGVHLYATNRCRK